MRGMPNILATRDDIEHLKLFIGTEYDTPEARSSVREMLEAIRNTARHYVFTRTLESEEDRAGPEPEYRVLTEQGESGKEIHEFRLVDNPHSRFAAMGLTLEEIDELIFLVSSA